MQLFFYMLTLCPAVVLHSLLRANTGPVFVIFYIDYILWKGIFYLFLLNLDAFRFIS